MVETLKRGDYNDWLKLAGEVEPLFGPMVNEKEFQDGILDCIEKNSAFGIRDDSGSVAGIIALNRIDNEIVWLAVGENHRGHKYGDTLVKKAIEELKGSGDIFVQTFGSGVDIGRSARHVYEKNGFTEYKSAGKNPAGLETVIMVWKKNNPQ